MSDLKILHCDRLWVSKGEIINFIDNSLEKTLDLEDIPPEIPFVQTEYNGVYGVTEKQVIEMDLEHKSSSPPIGAIKVHTFWEGNSWIKTCYFYESDSPLGRREAYCGHVELFRVLGNERLTDVEIACGWSLFQPYWEWVARRLHKKFGQPPLPLRGRALYKKPPDEFASFFVHKVMDTNNPPIGGLKVGIKENGESLIYWSDKSSDEVSDWIKVVFEPTGDESLLLIYALDSAWGRLSWWWELLYRRMENEHLVEVITPWQSNDKVPEKQEPTLHIHKKPGRKHNPDDIWAWEQINQLNRQAAEVYKEWLERSGVKKRDLADPDRQFKRIIVLGWMTKS